MLGWGTTWWVFQLQIDLQAAEATAKSTEATWQHDFSVIAPGMGGQPGGQEAARDPSATKVPSVRTLRPEYTAVRPSGNLT